MTTFASVVAWLALLVGATSTPASAAAPWQWPIVPAIVVHEFDPPDNPYGSGHRGVDLAAAVGQDIVAPAAGLVTFAGVVAGRGVVVVSHGDLRTTYEPVDGHVGVGAQVAAGEVIASVEAFGFHCSSPCLHWGAKRGDTYVDPTSFVLVQPSRLLPLWGDGAGSNAVEPQVLPGGTPGAPLRSRVAAVDSSLPAAEPSGPTNSPGAGNLMGSRAGVGALTASGDIRAGAARGGAAGGGESTAAATSPPVGSQRFSSSSDDTSPPGGEAVTNRGVALLLVLSAGAVLVGSGYRYAGRR